MNKTFSGISLAFGLLGGCGSEAAPAAPAGPAAPTATAPSIAEESRQDLERLRGLQVFHAGRLLLALPDEATACYALPCPGWEEEVAAEVRRQMPRLERLVAKAETLRLTVQVDPAGELDAAQVARDLQTLRDLQLIEVGELVAAEPVAEPSCYNLPCPGAVERENLTRAAIVHELAAAADELAE